MQKVRKEEDGKVVVEVGVGLVRGAKGAICKGVRTVGEVEAAGVYGCDARLEELV